jgi:UDP-N-acetylmuramyl pentapeptide phosphotransferase/UDP-N-acetylglucosamine-1-phosphate transferase
LSNLVPPLAAFAAAAVLLRLLLLPQARRWMLDRPNFRSLHAAPVPRTGGLGLVPAAALGMALAGSQLLAAGLALGLMLLSVVDDWKGLSARVRLLAHLAIGLTFVLGVAGQSGWPVIAVLVLAVAWMTNLYNFMDGSDGLAGGMAVFGFGAYAGAAWLGGDQALAVASLSVAAGAGAFLLFNFPPARIFMGDAGSIPLGFLAAALGMAGWRDGLWPAWFPAAVFASFVLDATITLLRRALRGEGIWRAHRSHYYQRQILMGWTHRQLALLEYSLMGTAALAAVFALHLAPAGQALVLGLLVGLHLAAGAAVDLRWRARQEA